MFPRLLERRDQMARTLSGGERRMLGIGRGLMTSGQIMLSMSHRSVWRRS